jgi:hypothetical protein
MLLLLVGLVTGGVLGFVIGRSYGVYLGDKHGYKYRG